MLQVIAPAKINLFLHVVGKNKNKYHMLQSLVSFADFGDIISIKPADEYNFTVTGDFSSKVSAENNLITEAVNDLCALINKKPHVDIHLEKNIPVGAGLGGGSADAAAVLKALIAMWRVDINEKKLGELLAQLGADVPMCFAQKTAFIEGIGDIILPIDYADPIYAVLVYPNMHCNTKNVFDVFQSKFSNPIDLAINDNMINFLRSTKNDLTSTAEKLYPEIKNCLTALEQAPACQLSRMSGSGSSCFGIFDSYEDAQNALKFLRQNNPTWWVKKTVLNVV